ncbi:MMPL family transporter [Lactobacillus delbrueckii]|uniref:Membrane protein n=1 Tax=Lactobacillus delbrueckii subsp. bulgaricus TaxID=1585 RepID=A0AAV5PFL0_LACDE|nr:MMPL family transporter [Lactobacillus delbrueckii]ADY85723.1 Membrane protein [Lactobacillus delbrueckii subsp. bulgaricus 2038]MCD5459242.1 MMPL family transporter [Lactobacillus delbrueckii subsp. bulgaricus]MCD9227103.1 MMPL family transporter [Lactobacillus delbrueckii subsp. bulgaricus]MCT3472731.1 MMPL family transporter [Lactobacillus delbrueckii subsp. bulgaricus]OAL40917.1 membrane protein MmpL family [Lactobacillus delbrueckii subsp. bulgaricus]
MKKLLKNHLGALIAWVLILVISLVALPNVDSLTRAHSEISLPSNVESEAAKLIKNEWGNKKKNTYEVAVVFNKKSGKLTETDQGNIEASIDRLTSNQKKYGIKDYLAPQNNIATKKLLKSKDGTTWVMQMNIAKSHGSISQVYDEINKVVKTSGVRTYVTGADVLNNDFTSSIQEGIKKTELITVVFIFIVLIIVFRSPVVPLVSLLTVGVSFLVSFSIVANLVNQVNFPFSNFTQVFMVIVLFGIGTDYNILLYNHFKEYLGNGLGVVEATKDSIKKAGRTILYSGSSILIGFSVLGLANFSVYRSASGVAVGVLVLLIVLLTLTPFFMATLGKKMFWPSKEFAGEKPSKMWHGISSATLKRPVVFLAAVAVVVAPFFVTYSNVLNYDDTAEISDSVPSKQGLNLVQKHFSEGMAMPSYLYIKSDHTLDNEKDLKLIDELTRKLRNSEGVDKVMSATEPYNEKIKLLYVKKQLKSVTDGIAKLEKGVGKLTKGSEQVTSGAKKLANGADQLDEGTGTLSDEAKDLYTGTQTLTNGAKDLTANMNTLVAGLDQLKSQLSENASSLNADQLDQLSSGLTDLNSGLQSLQGQVGSLQTGLTNAKTGLTTARTGFGTASAAAGSLASSISKVSDPTLKAELQKELETLNSGLGTVGSGLTTARTAATNMNSAASGIQSATGSLGSSTSAVSTADLSTEVQQLQAAVDALATGAHKLYTGSNSLYSGLSKGMAGALALSQGADKLQSGTSQLSSGASKLAENTPAITSGLTAVNNGLVSAGSYLNGLRKSKASDTFYVPSYVLKHNADLQKSLKVFLSPDKKSAMIIIILDSNPSSESAAEHSQALSAMARKSLKGTDLGKAEVEMGGQSSTIEDTKNTASGDFTRTMAIMLIGIGIALIFVTRSLLQPIYILGTLLLAYISSLSITRWVVSGVMGRSTLAWNVPFFTFIMLIALGVDYSIFVMMRYRDSDPHALPSARILEACTVIGTVVISAAVILGGTFAALIPSGVPTLIEVAIGVIIGLAILVFLMPINLSASTKLTYEGFPWPKWAGRKKSLSFGKKS